MLVRREVLILSSEVSAAKQWAEESVPERVIRAVNGCRAALLAGYTTYRDLGTESMNGKLGLNTLSSSVLQFCVDYRML